MPKYLVEATYLSAGSKGVQKEGGSGRRTAVEQLFRSLGGTVESFYFAFGDKDVFIVGDLPDNATAAALAIKVNAAGSANCRITVLLTAEELDLAVTKTSIYRPPGFDEQAEVSKWEGEGGNLPGATR